MLTAIYHRVRILSLYCRALNRTLSSVTWESGLLPALQIDTTSVLLCLRSKMILCMTMATQATDTY